MVSWFGPQNQAGFGLSVASQNRQREVGVGHALRSSSLLGVEASLARVFQSGLKTDEGTMAGGARGIITEVASEEAEDGRVDATGDVGLCYPCFVVFFLLCLRGNSSHLAFCLGLYIGL
jgi:hypothetical protein